MGRRQWCEWSDERQGSEHGPDQRSGVMMASATSLPCTFVGLDKKVLAKAEEREYEPEGWPSIWKREYSP